MRYFGISKKVKVSDKLEPRDFDRSKVFSEVTPVIHKSIFLVIFYKDLSVESLIKRDYMKDANILNRARVSTLDIHITLSCSEECLHELRKETYYITYREIK